jgi:inorganic pyrophosphatase
MANLATLPAFVDRRTFRAVVESPRGAAVKLKYDPERQILSLSRPLPVGLSFPYDFGFVPSTRAADEDPVDVMLVWDVATFPGIVIECRAVGVVRVKQNRENYDRRTRIRNDRILAVPTAAERDGMVPLTSAARRRLRDEISNFLLAVTVLEGKDATILGWGGPSEAVALIRKSLTR